MTHGIFNLTFRVLQHTSSEVTITKYDQNGLKNLHQGEVEYTMLNLFGMFAITVCLFSFLNYFLL